MRSGKGKGHRPKIGKQNPAASGLAGEDSQRYAPLARFRSAWSTPAIDTDEWESASPAQLCKMVEAVQNTLSEQAPLTREAEAQTEVTQVGRALRNALIQNWRALSIGGISGSVLTLGLVYLIGLAYEAVALPGFTEESLALPKSQPAEMQLVARDHRAKPILDVPTREAQPKFDHNGFEQGHKEGQEYSVELEQRLREKFYKSKRTGLVRLLIGLYINRAGPGKDFKIEEFLATVGNLVEDKNWSYKERLSSLENFERVSDESLIVNRALTVMFKHVAHHPGAQEHFKSIETHVDNHLAKLKKKHDKEFAYSFRNSPQLKQELPKAVVDDFRSLRAEIDKMISFDPKMGSLKAVKRAIKITDEITKPSTSPARPQRPSRVAEGAFRIH